MRPIYISGKGMCGGKAPLLLQSGLGTTYDSVGALEKEQGRIEGLGVKRDLMDKLESLSLTKKPKNIKFSIKEKK